MQNNNGTASKTILRGYGIKGIELTLNASQLLNLQLLHADIEVELEVAGLSSIEKKFKDFLDYVLEGIESPVSNNVWAEENKPSPYSSAVTAEFSIPQAVANVKAEDVFDAEPVPNIEEPKVLDKIDLNYKENTARRRTENRNDNNQYAMQG